MITTSVTPLRVSFLGGGSDYEEHFLNGYKGFVFGTTINLYVYVSAIRNSKISGKKYKISYRELDECDEIEDIKHPVVKACLQKLNWDGGGLHISTMSDVPAGTGLGSSSSFTVGLIQTIYSLQGAMDVNPRRLAEEAINIERRHLNEAGGIQDQLHASFGGLSAYEISGGGILHLSGVATEKVEYLSQSMFLVPIGTPRSSSIQAEKWIEIAQSQPNQESLDSLSKIAEETYSNFQKAKDAPKSLEILANAMNESWEIKSSLAKTANQKLGIVETMIQRGLSAGAMAGKLCGAGSSGFVLFLVPIERQKKFLSLLSKDNPKQIQVESRGSWLANLG